MTEYAFKPVKVPSTSAAPNPFIAAVKDLATNGQEDDGVQFDTPMGDKTKKGKWSNVEKVKRQLQDAGKSAGVTVRTSVEEDKPRKGSALVTFRTSKRIVRKPKDEAATTPGGSGPAGS